MSSATRKMKRSRTTSRSVLGKREAPVLIVRPHNSEGLTSEETHKFEAFCFGSGIAEIGGRGSKVPETARNRSIEEFLTHEKHAHKTHIFFLDDDSPPLENDAIVKLLRHRKPVVCTPTPIMRYDYELENIVVYWNTLGLEEGHTEEKPKFRVYEYNQKPKGLFRCYRTGGTGMLIRRDVLERLKPPYQVSTYNENYTDIIKSEDIYFSDKIRKAGYEIWADGDTVSRHLHRIDILDIVALMMSLMDEKFMRDDPLYAKMVRQKLERIVDQNDKLKRFVNARS